MGAYALYAMSRVGKESKRGEKILVLPLRTRNSHFGTSHKDAIKKDVFQLSSFPIELAAYLKRI